MRAAASSAQHEPAHPRRKRSAPSAGVEHAAVRREHRASTRRSSRISRAPEPLSSATPRSRRPRRPRRAAKRTCTSRRRSRTAAGRARSLAPVPRAPESRGAGRGARGRACATAARRPTRARPRPRRGLAGLSISPARGEIDHRRCRGPRGLCSRSRGRGLSGRPEPEASRRARAARTARSPRRRRSPIAALAAVLTACEGMLQDRRAPRRRSATDGAAAPGVRAVAEPRALAGGVSALDLPKASRPSACNACDAAFKDVTRIGTFKDVAAARARRAP